MKVLFSRSLAVLLVAITMAIPASAAALALELARREIDRPISYTGLREATPDYWSGATASHTSSATTSSSSATSTTSRSRSPERASGPTATVTVTESHPVFVLFTISGSATTVTTTTTTTTAPNFPKSTYLVTVYTPPAPSTGRRLGWDFRIGPSEMNTCYNLNGPFQNNIDSITAPSSLLCTLYEHRDCTGFGLVFHGDIPEMERVLPRVFVSIFFVALYA